MSIQELESEILKLNTKDKLSLIEKLLLSLDDPDEAENLKIWAAEAEKRGDQIRLGQAKTLTAEEVYAKIRAIKQ